MVFDGLQRCLELDGNLGLVGIQSEWWRSPSPSPCLPVASFVVVNVSCRVPVRLLML